MSKEFCLPIELKILPARYLLMIVLALYCIPVLLVLVFLQISGFGLIGLGVTAVVIVALGRELSQQRHANTATQLRINVAQRCWLVRCTESCEVELVGHLDCRWLISLLLKHNKCQFHVLLYAKAHSPQQLHRLRLLFQS